MISDNVTQLINQTIPIRKLQQFRLPNLNRDQGDEGMYEKLSWFYICSFPYLQILFQILTLNLWVIHLSLKDNKTGYIV